MIMYAVECYGRGPSLRKPCWCSSSCTESLTIGRSRDSRIFIGGGRIETGRYEVPWSAGLPGFNNGIIVDVGQVLDTQGSQVLKHDG